MLDLVLADIDARRGHDLPKLIELLSIPSISAQSEHAGDVRRCADWMVDHLTKIGLSARLAATEEHPAVLAHNDHRAGRPTILFYGHYDVQPPDPLDEWTTPPFEPTIRDNAVFARGAADDKGQVFAHLIAIDAWMRHGGLPVNLVVLIEGEEECGSAHLAPMLQRHRADLAADIALISDSHQYARGIPAITYGLRGLVYLHLELRGPSHDLHSGLHGGAVANPANVLTKLLASLHDDEGRVNIPGFYDEVAEPTSAERRMGADLPEDDAAYAAGIGLRPDQLAGEKGFSTLERRTIRPTFDIHGLSSGYQGPGAKTVLPATASAKISCRLVPNQDPARINRLLTEALRQRCPVGVRLTITPDHLAPGVVVPVDGPAIALAAEAVEIGFGRRPVLIRSGGSIPVVSMLKESLDLDTLMVGFGLPDDRVHSPNEKFDLDALHSGARTAAALYDRLSRL